MRNLFLLMTMIFCTYAMAHDNVRLITVTGRVEKTFQPDIVHMNIRVWGKGSSGNKAQLASQTHYETLKKSLEKFNVKKEDIKTTSYDLSPESQFNPKTNKSNITGYLSTQWLQVTLRKMDDAGPFVDSLISDSKSLTAGVNVQSLNFDLSTKDEAERSLLGEAVKVAEAEAEVLAKAARVRLKGIYRLSPNGNAPSTKMYAIQEEDMMMLSATGSSSEKRVATEFSSGEIKVMREVSAEYLID